MRILYFIFILVITFGLNSNAQVYPKKAIIEKDTVAILHIDQVRKINIKLVEKDKINEQLLEMTNINSTYKNLLESSNKKVKILEESNEYLKSKSRNYELIINEKDKLYRKQKRKTILVGGLSIALGVSSLVLLLTN